MVDSFLMSVHVFQHAGKCLKALKRASTCFKLLRIAFKVVEVFENDLRCPKVIEIVLKCF